MRWPSHSEAIRRKDVKQIQYRNSTHDYLFIHLNLCSELTPMKKTFTFNTRNGLAEVKEGDVIYSIAGERFIIRTPLHSDGLVYVTHADKGWQASYYPSAFGLAIPERWWNIPPAVKRATRSSQTFQDLISPTTAD